METDTADKMDISSKTIVVLVVLTVIISILSTLVVLNEVSNIGINGQARPASVSGGTAQGKVTLGIVDTNNPVAATGHVTLGILPTTKQR
jgi:hypothetical protein